MDDVATDELEGMLCVRKLTAARVLDVSLRTVERLIEAGELQTTRVGDSTRVLSANILAYLRANAGRPTRRQVPNGGGEPCKPPDEGSAERAR